MATGKQRAKRPCLVPSCAGFASNGGYCDKHQDRIRKLDRARGNSHQRGYDNDWRKARDAYLQDNPLCVVHLKRGLYVPATVVDHIVAHKGDKALFWQQSNWQALCESCHNSKTATSDKGAWSPARAKAQANTTGQNEFIIGDRVICTNVLLQSRLNCDDSKMWEVLDVIANTIEVTDGDTVKRLHYSHFKKIG